MDIIGKLLQGKKTYITTLIASCDEFFTCFLFFFRWSKVYIMCSKFSWKMVFGVFRGFSKDP